MDQKSCTCHILFVSRSESRHYATLPQSVDGPGVLTVGETPDFLDAGGVMTFVIKTEANHRELLQFEGNLSAATGAHLRISSKLLAIARRVVNLEKKG
jgi:hypothetical protein